MDDTTKIALASAVAGGYLLGRTKKGRVALTLALMLAGRGISAQPRQLAADAAQWLGEVPQVAQLKEQLRDEGTDAARKVMTSLTERGVGSLADAISSRTPAVGQQPADEEADEEADEAEEAYEEGEEEPEDSGEDDSDRSTRRTPPARKSAKARKTTPTKKAAQTKKAANKPPAKKTAAKKTGPASRSDRRR